MTGYAWVTERLAADWEPVGFDASMGFDAFVDFVVPVGFVVSVGFVAPLLVMHTPIRLEELSTVRRHPWYAMYL